MLNGDVCVLLPVACIYNSVLHYSGYRSAVCGHFWGHHWMCSGCRNAAVAAAASASDCYSLA